MRAKLFGVLFMSLALVLFAPNGKAGASLQNTTTAPVLTTIGELTSAGDSLDGLDVSVQGEAVGDIINAEPGYKWITLLDAGASMSVRVKDGDAAKIKYLGRHESQGTRVKVTGAFEVDCTAHDGLIDMHATSLTVLDEGYKIERAFDSNKILIGLGLLFLGVGIFVLHWRLRERTR